MSRQKATKDDTLSSRQAAYVGARARATQAAAAAAVGVSVRTATRWDASPAVRAALREQTSATLAEAARVGAALTVRALRVAGDILDDDDAPTAARLAACRVVLSTTPALVEVHELDARIAALESAMPAPDARRPGGAPGKL